MFSDQMLHTNEPSLPQRGPGETIVRTTLTRGTTLALPMSRARSDSSVRTRAQTSFSTGLLMRTTHVALASRPLGVSLLVPLLGLLVWTLVARQNWVAPQILPDPSLVWTTLKGMVTSGEISENLLVSLRRVLLGFSLGSTLGLLLGWWMGLFPRIERLLYPSIAALAQVPALGFIPLLMMFLGIGEALKLTIVAKAVFVPVVIHSMRGVQNVPSGWLELASVCEHRKLQILVRVVLPASLREVITGLRLALSQAWLALVTVELLASSEGIGYVMIRGRQLNQIDVVLVTALVIGMVGYLLDRVLRLAERVTPTVRNFGPNKRPATTASKRTIREGLLLPVIVIILWAIVSHARWVNVRFLPSPVQTVRTLLVQIRDGELNVALASSLQRVVLGLLLGCVSGVLIGTLLGRLNWLGALVLPSFHAFRQVTLIAWVPLLTLWAGQDEPAKLIFIALAVFVPMTLCACEGARAVSSAHLEVTEVFGVSRWTRFRWVILPSALPHLCAGLELGIVYAWLATIGAEYFFRAAPGIGNLMVDGREHFQMDLVLCGVCVVGGVGFLVNRLTLLLRARLLRWAVQ